MMQFVIILYETVIIYDRERGGTALCLPRARELYRERGARIT